MSVPLKRMENGSHNKGNSPKRQKQFENEKLTFTDREVEAFLCHLTEEKLLDVVRENNRSHLIARRIIERRSNFGFVQLSNKIDPKQVNSPWFIEFLKLFGNEIKWLEVIYEEEYHHFNCAIEKAVFDHCTDSLEKIHFINAGRFSMFEIVKPFKNVTEVILETGTICSPFSNIAEWFPKLKSIKLTNLQLHSTSGDKIFGNQICFELEKIEIRNLMSKDGGNVYMEEIAMMVQNSPNLNYVWIDDQNNVDELLEAIAELNPILPNLHLDLFLRKDVGKATIHFKSLKQLDLNKSKQALDIATDEIKHLYIDSDGERFNEKWLKLLENNKHVRKITVHAEWETDEIKTKFINLVKTFPELQEIGIMTQFVTDHINDLVLCCGTLNKIHFRRNELDGEPTKKDALIAIFDSFQPKWKLYQDDNPPYPMCRYFCFDKVNTQEE